MGAIVVPILHQLAPGRIVIVKVMGSVFVIITCVIMNVVVGNVCPFAISGDGSGGNTGSGGNSGTNNNNGTPIGDRGSVCLHGDGSVLLRSGEVKKVRDVRVNDEVQVGKGEYSPVFMFTHADPNLVTQFVKVMTEGNETTTVTPSHYMHSDQGIVQAGEMQVGDSVLLADRYVARIKSVSRFMSKGVFNPQTMQGDIVVDGFLVSTYTS